MIQNIALFFRKFLPISILIFCLSTKAAPEHESLPLPVLEPMAQSEKTKLNPKKAPPKTFLFDFDNKELSAIIDEFAAKRGANIIMLLYALPLNQKLTCKLGKMSLDEAEQYLKTFLEFAGYEVPDSIGRLL